MSSMAYGGASAAQSSAITVAQPHHHHGRRRQIVDSVAKTLGMDPRDVGSALASGTTMSQLATQKGVSHDDLVKAIEQGLQSGSAAGSTQDPSHLQKIAEEIANRVGGQARRPELGAVDADADANGSGSSPGAVSYLA